MPGKVERARWWGKRKLSCISLGFSFLEILIIGAAVVFALTYHRTEMQMAGVRKLAAIAWLVGGLGSFIFAIAGLVAGPYRGTAVAALIVAMSAWMICGTQMLV